jgi:hypothetical protein
LASPTVLASSQGLLDPPAMLRLATTFGVAGEQTRMKNIVGRHPPLQDAKSKSSLLSRIKNGANLER